MTILFALEDFNRKNLKTFVEPLMCTSQLSKWNIPCDASTNVAHIDKTLSKNFNLETVCPQNLNQKIMLWPSAPNEKYLDNDSMSTLKRDLQSVNLPVDFVIPQRWVQISKISEKEEIKCQVVEFDHACETNDDTDFEFETVDNFPLPFNEFYDISSQDSFKDTVDKYVVNISLTNEEIKNIEYSTRGQQ